MNTTVVDDVARSELFRVFLKIGLLSFGGPAAQIALMHRILVDERRWLTEKQFLDALSFCMLLPGPEAMQLATYAGWKLRGVPGGLVAGTLFVLPGAMVIFLLATLYVNFGDVTLVDTLFLGVQTAAVVIVLEALLRISKRALRGRPHWLIAGLAFLAIFFLDVPFPLIVISAGLYGALAARNAERVPDDPRPADRAPRSFATLFTGLVIWGLPFIILAVVSGPTLLDEVGFFFSKLAVVTFGGAYAVLAYMAQDVVVGLGWLTATEMMDGLGLAETTPGPLILVTEFVGFLAGFRDGGFWLAVAAALVTLWVTFVPCFIWIFVGAPYIERISHQPRLAGALHAITASVVGVILNLSLWFALHVLFDTVVKTSVGPVQVWTPELMSLRPASVILILLSGFLLLKRHVGIGWTLGISAAAAWLIEAVTTFS